MDDCHCFICCNLFFFNDTATTEIYTLSLHDALPIYAAAGVESNARRRIVHHRTAIVGRRDVVVAQADGVTDRKSTRLNSSHLVISYAVFCLKKKKEREQFGISA